MITKYIINNNNIYKGLLVIFSMKFTTTLKKGKAFSYHTNIPMKVISALKLTEGDRVIFDINRLDSIKDCQCDICGLQFSSDNELENISCPACKACNISIINEDTSLQERYCDNCNLKFIEFSGEIIKCPVCNTLLD